MTPVSLQHTCGPSAGVVVKSEWLAWARGVEAGSVDLLYVDPPFNTGRAKRGRGGAYADDFGTLDQYIAWLRPRLAASVRLLRPSGSLIVHVDWRSSHRVRVLLDELLGEANFVNHLVWAYGLGGSSPRRFARKHDDLLWYCVDAGRYWFDPPRVNATSARMKGMTKQETDVLEVASINNMAAERTGYPTQKPLALLEMLVRACCPPGGVVADPCCGSGTTLVAALRSGRRALGCDVSERAVALAKRRLAEQGTEAGRDSQGSGRQVPK